jgi:hypothetical protein
LLVTFNDVTDEAEAWKKVKAKVKVEVKVEKRIK